MLFFPLADALQGQEIIRISYRFGTDIDHTGWADKFVRRNAVDGVVGKVFPRDPVDWSVKMSAGVLAGLEAIPVPGGTSLIVARELPDLECGRVVPL